MNEILDKHNDETLWYVMRVYKKEREAEELLLGSHGLSHFIAKKYFIRTYQGKQKSMLLPSIPGIIFVNASRKQIREFKNYCPFLQYCFTKQDGVDIPLIVPDKQMTNFMTIAKRTEMDITYFSPDEISLSKGTRVKVHGGAFDGVEGTLLKVKGKRSKRIVVKIDGIIAVASAEIEPDLIEIL